MPVLVIIKHSLYGGIVQGPTSIPVQESTDLRRRCVGRLSGTHYQPVDRKFCASDLV